jgi:hypothetical protein
MVTLAWHRLLFAAKHFSCLPSVSVCAPSSRVQVLSLAIYRPGHVHHPYLYRGP